MSGFHKGFDEWLGLNDDSRVRENRNRILAILRWMAWSCAITALLGVALAWNSWNDRGVRRVATQAHTAAANLNVLLEENDAWLNVNRQMIRGLTEELDGHSGEIGAKFLTVEERLDALFEGRTRLEALIRIVMQLGPGDVWIHESVSVDSFGVATIGEIVLWGEASTGGRLIIWGDATDDDATTDTWRVER